jgi:ABC transporter transmembrane region
MAAERLLSPALVSAPTAETRRRLSELLAPGGRRLTASGALTTAAAAGTAAGFFAVAAVAQDVLEGHAGWAHDAVWLLLLAGAAAIRAGTSYLAARLAVDGALTVEQHLRARLVDRLLGGRGVSLDSAAQATAVMDEVERVGSYAERYQPARVAATLVPLVLLAAVFPLSWLVGVLLVLCAPLPPVNLSVVGMGTAAVARRHGEELRHLSGYFLDRLRGLATLRALGAERAELERVRAASARLTHSSMAVLRVAFISAAVLEAIVTVAVAVVAMYIGLTLLGYVHVPGLPSQMSLRTGLFLLMVTPLYFQPVRALAAAYHERADALAAIEALRPLLDADPTPTMRGAGRSLLAPPAVEIAELTVLFPRPRRTSARRPLTGDRAGRADRRHRRLGSRQVDAAASARRRPRALGRQPAARRRAVEQRTAEHDQLARPATVPVPGIAGGQHRPRQTASARARCSSRGPLGRPRRRLDAPTRRLRDARRRKRLGPVRRRGAPGGARANVPQARAVAALRRADRSPRCRQRGRDRGRHSPPCAFGHDGCRQPLARAPCRLRSRDHARPRPAGRPSRPGGSG